MRHPLINDDSKHYETHDKPAIYDLESELDIIEAQGWCKGNIFKYHARLGKKSTQDNFVSDLHKQHHLEEIKQKDLKKIETYKNYLDLLVELRQKLWKSMMNGNDTMASLTEKSVRQLIDEYMPDIEYN